jgi:O-antigen ligase/tetratricopeptide (TPR) repeat protein
MSSPRPAPVPPPGSLRDKLILGLEWGMEIVIWVILVISPWLVGGYLPQHVLLMSLGLCLLLLLWSLQQMLRWQLTLYFCPVSLLLILLFVLSAMALFPLSRAALLRISPATAQLYDDLLPQTREVPMSGPLAESLPFVPGSTLSLNPGATQNQLMELLAVFILFGVTRHALASPQSLRRLAFVLVLNGCCLSIFGLIQKVHSPGTDVYGITVAGAEVFGPFINRNHFASYVNFSICLGIGLFLSNLTKNPRGTVYQPAAPAPGKIGHYHFTSVLDILQHPLAVWLLAPVAICITAVATSLSRGGILALAAGLGCLVFALRRRGWKTLLPLMFIFVLAGALLVWYGAEPTLERFDQELLAHEGRFNIWRACWDLARRFPIFGTGPGTFFIVEPLARPANANQSVVHLHAHNEYLEALVEGGMIRLAIILALVALVVWYGLRAATQSRHASAQALAAGALGGAVALAIQSIGEFGIHLPSIAAVTAVVAAQLTALGGSAGTHGQEARLRGNVFGIGPLLSVPLAFSLALPLLVGAWRLSSSEINRMVALRLSSEAKNSRDLQQALHYFDEAIRFAPAHQRVRLERYETQQLQFQVIATENRDRTEILAQPQLFAEVAMSPLNWPASPMAALTQWCSGTVLEQTAQSQQFRHSQEQTWPDQQRHLLAARDNCPLAWRAQLDIAQYVLPQKAKIAPQDRFLYWRQSDPQEAYLRRVKLLHPHRAETWFLCGQQEGNNGDREEAIRSWRRSLELSDEFLEPIVRESTLSFLQPELKLSTQELMEKLIPANNPRQLIKAAWLLYPKVTEMNQRRPFMEAALALLEKNEKILEPEYQYYYGLALWGVTKREQALRHLQDAVRRTPRRYPWRLDLARLQFELQHFSDSREQAFMVLQADANNVEAKELMEKLDRVQRPGVESDR